MTYSQADITVPYAVANFAEIRHKGYYYVDKTNYIPLLERYKAPVFLRPRRFGKSLLVSMLAHYYDRNMATQFKDLFGGTWIGEHPTNEHNQYLVVRYDFSTTSVASKKEDIEKNFNAVNCSPLRTLVERNRDLFGDFRFREDGNASNMLVEVCEFISSHNLPPLYILMQVQQAKVLLPRVLPYQPLLLGYDHPEGQLQNGFAKLDDQECIYELLQRIE